MPISSPSEGKFGGVTATSVVVTPFRQYMTLSTSVALPGVFVFLVAMTAFFLAFFKEVVAGWPSWPGRPLRKQAPHHELVASESSAHLNNFWAGWLLFTPAELGQGM